MRSFFKWAGITVVRLLGVLLVVVVAFYARGVHRISHVKTLPAVANGVIATDSVSIERGRHLASAIAPCADCHGGGLRGRMFPTPAALVTMPAPNLTRGRGGVGANSLADWDRAIRHGIGKDGRALIIMPAQAYAHMSDDEFGALVAYLNSLAPVDNVLPKRKLGPLGAVLISAGGIPVAADIVAKARPTHATIAAARNVAYGEHLVQLATCAECHGEDLAGKTSGPGPHAPSLRAHAAQWTEAQFRNTLRTGRTPDGRTLNGEEMPWPFFANMSDDELGAVWLYIRSLRS